MKDLELEGQLYAVPEPVLYMERLGVRFKVFYSFRGEVSYYYVSEWSNNYVEMAYRHRVYMVPDWTTGCKEESGIVFAVNAQGTNKMPVGYL